MTKIIKKILRKTALAGSVFLAATLAFLPAHADQALDNLSVGFELRERWETWRDPDLNSDADDGGSMVLQRIRLHFQYAAPQDITVFVQFQDSRVWGEETSVTSDEMRVDMHQGYVRFDKVMGENFTVWIGRQELKYGAERLVGPFGWNNVGRAFDGIRMQYAWEKVTAEMFGMKVKERTPPIGAGVKDRDDASFGGLHAAFKTEAFDALDFSLFYLRDRLEAAGEVAARGMDDTDNFVTLDARVGASHFDERLAWNAEAAYQTGERRTDDHRAWAAYARASWTLHKDTKTFVMLEANAASGDGDAADGDSNEFHNLFPTNHIYYGYIDFMGWRNTRSFRVGASSTGKKCGTWSLDFWRLGLDDAKGRWSSAGGATMGLDATGNSGRHVGDEIDLTWQRGFREGKVAFLVGYSYFTPGRFAKAERGEDDAHFAYVQMTVRLP